MTTRGEDTALRRESHGLEPLNQTALQLGAKKMGSGRARAAQPLQTGGAGIQTQRLIHWTEYRRARERRAVFNAGMNFKPYLTRLAPSAGKLALFATDLLLPRVCAACNSALPPGGRRVGWCKNCLNHVICRQERCQRCGLEGAGALCQTCRNSPPEFSRTLLLGAYRPPLDGIVRALKFAREPALAQALGAALAQHLAPPLEAEFGSLARAKHGARVVAVPLSAERLANRGYNQSLLIARVFAHRLGLSLDRYSLVRLRPGPPQSVLKPDERHHNAAGAYAIRPGSKRLAGAAILVVDDVMTTGATLLATARTLRAAGADSVINIVVARTPHVQRGPGSA